MLKIISKNILSISIIFATMSLSACSTNILSKISNLEPWVAPYERENLADPIMSFNKDPLSNKYRQHVFNTREGARGAGFSQGGGCGCN